MIRKRLWANTRVGFAGLALWFLAAAVAHASFIYKHYSIRDDQGQDVLCDPYVVQPNDWVYKVFRQKGEIAQKDFGEFLALFKRINPSVRDINLIRPGQRVMIPLRKLASGALTGQSSGTVTIPFVTINDGADPAPAGSLIHVVKPGDCVSTLIHRRFGTYGSADFRRAMDRFKAINPQIIDINRILIGQRVLLPQMYVDEQLLNRGLPDPAAPADTVQPQQAPATSLEVAARVFNARIRQRGVLHFPYGGADHALSLERFPMLEIYGGKRFLLAGNGPAEQTVEAARAKWPELTLLGLGADSGAEALVDAIAAVLIGHIAAGPIVFQDGDVEVSVKAKWIIGDNPPTQGVKRCITPVDSPDQKTPADLVRYLAGHRIIVAEYVRDNVQASAVSPRFAPLPAKALTIATAALRDLVARFVTALGYRFSPDVTVSFPYAGIQVSAVSNLISTAEGGAVFVDFGDLYGDGIQALHDAGFDMIQIDRCEDPSSVIRKISETLGLRCQAEPVICACPRPREHNIRLTFDRGLRLTGQNGAPDVLVSFSAVAPALADFLAAGGILPIIIDYQRG